MPKHPLSALQNHGCDSAPTNLAYARKLAYRGARWLWQIAREHGVRTWVSTRCGLDVVATPNFAETEP